MAKKKKASAPQPKEPRKPGNNTGLIVTLVFFVLTTLGLGALAYFGYADQEKLKADKDKAIKETATTRVEFQKERARKIILRKTLGIKADKDNEDLASAMADDPVKKEAMDEFSKVTTQLKGVRLYEIGDDGKPVRTTPEEGATLKEVPFEFDWALLTDIKGAGSKSTTGNDDPALGPKKTLPTMIDELRFQVKSLEAERKAAMDKADRAEKAAQSTTLHNNEAKQIYDKSIAAIKKDIDTRIEKLRSDFLTLSRDLMALNTRDVEKLTGLGTQNLDLEKDNRRLKKHEEELAKLLEKFNALLTAPIPDSLTLDEKKGEVLSKDAGFVQINLGSADHLIPGVTFSVLPLDAVWRTSDEKEQRIKAQLEVYDIVGPHLAKAKIVGEKDSLRDPIQKGDQLFNPAWKPGKVTRIAFAGIIDLDGDGIDDNKQFLRLLEAQGVVVDEYLQLRPPKRIQRDPDSGIRIETNYLVLAPDPRVTDLPGSGKGGTTVSEIQSLMGQMKNDATKFGVQQIEARKFMALMGLKLPNNPSPPFYEAYNRPLAVPTEAPPPAP